MADMEIQTVFFDIGDTLVRDAQNWIPGAKEFLGQISSTNLRLGLISNTGNLQRNELLSHLPHDFDFQDFEDELILISSEVGIEKPDIRIFLKAVEKAAVPPWTCFFVGEKLEETFAAQRAGMRSIRITRVPEDFNRLQSLLQ